VRQRLAAVALLIGVGVAAVASAAMTATAASAAIAPTAASFNPYAGTRAAVVAKGTKSAKTLVTADGRTRRYRTYVPSTIGDGASVPLVIALHGGLGSSAQFEANSGLDGLAESNKFIVVYPDGIGNKADGTGFQTWNGGYCCGPAVAKAVDDVGFVRRLVTVLQARLPIDRRRIYVVGHSNGGILAYRLACQMSDVITAIGVQAGSNVVKNCHPAAPVSVVHLHGTADTNMPIKGGKGSGMSTTVFVSARSAVATMASADHCSVSTPVVLVTSNPDVTAQSWKPCRSRAEVRFITVKGATHAWMGHPAQSSGSAAYVGVPYSRLDASRALLSFLLTKSK
jgi:polyhydroxybutyrate depolymerase